MLADPSHLLSNSAQQSLDDLGSFLRRWMGVELRVVAVESLNRHQLAAAMASSVQLPLSQVPGIGELESRIAAFLPTIQSFRGGLIRSLFPERLGLIHSPAPRTLVLLLAARERYVYCEYGAGVLSRLAVRPALEAARAVALSVMDQHSTAASLLPDDVAAGAAMFGVAPADFAAQLAVDTESKWASSLLEAFCSSLRMVAVRSVVKRGITCLLMLCIVAALAYRMLLSVRRARRTRAKYASWLAALAKAFPNGAQAPPLDGDCTICLGSVDALGNPVGSPTTVVAAGALMFPTPPPGDAAGGAGGDGRTRTDVRMHGAMAQADIVPPGWIAFTCSHRFHLLCAMQWLQRKNSCPLCREADPLPDTPPSLPRLLEGWMPRDSLAGAVMQVLQAAAVGTVTWCKDVTVALRDAIRGMSAREWFILLEFSISEWYTLGTLFLSLWRLRVALLGGGGGGGAQGGLASSLLTIRRGPRLLEGSITATELFA